MFISSELVLQISHSNDDLFMTGFTFNEVQTLEMEDFCRDFMVMSFDQYGNTVVLDMMRSMSYLFLTGFTFNEVQTLEMEDFCRDFIVMLFDRYGNTVILDMMRSMSYLPGMGLGRCQHGPNEFMAILDYDVPFGLKFIPMEADYRYMARLRKERVRAQMNHTLFDYPIHPYTLSLTDYFVRASEPQMPLDGIIGGLSTVQEAERPSTIVE